MNFSRLDVVVVVVVFQQNHIVYSNYIQGTLRFMSSKGLGNKTGISRLFVE